MSHSLEKYRAIAEPNFIPNLEEKFYSVHLAELSSGLNVKIQRDQDRLAVYGIDMENKPFEGYVTFSSYFHSEYRKLEDLSRAEIDTTIATLLDEAKQQVFIKNIIAELQVLQNEVSDLMISPKYEVYTDILFDKSQIFIEKLANIYLNSQKANFPKIHWLGDTKVLTTLFYELWKGQEKGKNESSLHPLIKANKQDIEALLINNFVDKDQKLLKASTMSDYLNTSKPENRSKMGVRIELNY